MKIHHNIMMSLLGTAMIVGLGGAQIHAATLYGQIGSGGELYTIDTNTLAATFIGSDITEDSPEIELTPDGSAIFASTSDFEGYFELNPADAMNVDTPDLFFPASRDTLTAMEFVGSTLYAGTTVAGAGGDAYLATVNLTTGVVTEIGNTGLLGSLGGLAYNDSTGVMYGVSTAGPGGSTLYTINLGTGVAAAVGPVTETTEGQLSAMTGLEFGTDGVLYAVSNSTLSNRLLSIDPLTGNTTDLGAITGLVGLGNINAITGPAIPEPASLALLGLGSLLIAARRTGASR